MVAASRIVFTADSRSWFPQAWSLLSVETVVSSQSPPGRRELGGLGRDGKFQGTSEALK